MSFQPMKFRVHDFFIRTHSRPIVLQSTMGSSALVALSNFILLSQPLWSKFQTEGGNGRPKYVCREVLTQMIEMVVVRNLEKLLAEEKIDKYSMLNFWNQLRSIIRLLSNGLSLKPKITSTGFEYAEEAYIFDVLGAQLCHGWVVDSEANADIAEVIGMRSYEEILAMSEITLEDSSEITSEALIVKKFLDNSKDQLTPYGLICLHKEIADASLSVLFKNNYFHVVYKHKGTLLILQADEEQLKKYPDAMWSSLEAPNGVRRLFTSTFTPIEQQVMGSDDKGTVNTSDRLKSKPSKKKRDRSKRQEPLKKGMDEVRSDLEVLLQPSAEIQEVEAEITQEELDDAMSVKFMDFLSGFTEEGADKPYFEGQVKALHHCGSFKMKVSFNDLKSCNEDNARYICNNMPRVSERLTQCVRDFLLSHKEFKTKSTDVFEKTKLEFSDLPAPNSVLPYKTFAKNNKMHRVWMLFDFGRKKVNGTTYVGRQAGLGLLNCILKKHKTGHCWAGSFREEDIEVVTHNDGSLEFVIKAEVSYDFTEENMIADFNTFCVILFPYFISDELHEMPAYFDQFQIDYLIHMPKFEDKEAYDRWQKYMSSHFAFKSPQVCATLITETFEACNKESLANPTDAILDIPGDLKNWVQFILNSGSLTLNDTYQHGARDSGPNRYDELSYWLLLMFGRHYSRHMLQTTKDDGTIIPVQDLVIIGLMLGHVLQGEMAKVIRYIMMKNNFGGPLLSSAWRHFEASETYDEEVQEVNTADVATSAAPPDMVGSPIEPEA